MQKRCIAMDCTTKRRSMGHLDVRSVGGFENRLIIFYETEWDKYHFLWHGNLITYAQPTWMLLQLGYLLPVRTEVPWWRNTWDPGRAWHYYVMVEVKWRSARDFEQTSPSASDRDAATQSWTWLRSVASYVKSSLRSQTSTATGTFAIHVRTLSSASRIRRRTGELTS